MSKENRILNMITQIAVALIGAFSILAGVYVGSSLSSNASKEAMQISYKNELLQQRIEIINRAALIYGKSPGVKDIWTVYLKEFHSKPIVSIELSKTLAEYNSEFNAVITLSGIYFGPKTHEALKAMGEKKSPWWEKDDELVKNYMAAMASELKYLIE